MRTQVLGEDRGGRFAGEAVSLVAGADLVADLGFARTSAPGEDTTVAQQCTGATVVDPVPAQPGSGPRGDPVLNPRFGRGDIGEGPLPDGVGGRVSEDLVQRRDVTGLEEPQRQPRGEHGLPHP
nr:hypothetical protein [Nocardia farcinica]UEX26139.1 hypothetical protein LMJ57_29580 [Nocardia farcinica]